MGASHCERTGECFLEEVTFAVRFGGWEWRREVWFCFKISMPWVENSLVREDCEHFHFQGRICGIRLSLPCHWLRAAAPLPAIPDTGKEEQFSGSCPPGRPTALALLQKPTDTAFLCKCSSSCDLSDLDPASCIPIKFIHNH